MTFATDVMGRRGRKSQCVCQFVCSGTIVLVVAYRGLPVESLGDLEASCRYSTIVLYVLLVSTVSIVIVLVYCTHCFSDNL